MVKEGKQTLEFVRLAPSVKHLTQEGFLSTGDDPLKRVYTQEEAQELAVQQCLVYLTPLQLKVCGTGMLR